jgi:hypothetical protein
MKTLMMMASLALTCAAVPAFAASEADCQAMWKKADANNDGVLSEQESVQYWAMMRVHEKTLPPDGKLTRAAFMEACKGDVYASRKNDAGAPLKGANSFTEGQAKDRAIAAGFTSVSSMKKDGNGIWRGTAMQEGKSVPVAVDYKGNVVVTAPNAQ